MSEIRVTYFDVEDEDKMPGDDVERTLPLKILYSDSDGFATIVDAEDKIVADGMTKETAETFVMATNELAQLRQKNKVLEEQRDSLEKRVKELEQTIYALARMWSVIDEWHSKVVDRLVKGRFDSAKELAIMEYPCLQGHRNQMALIKIGKNEFDNDVVAEIISKLQADNPKESPDEV